MRAKLPQSASHSRKLVTVRKANIPHAELSRQDRKGPHTPGAAQAQLILASRMFQINSSKRRRRKKKEGSNHKALRITIPGRAARRSPTHMEIT